MPIRAISTPRLPPVSELTGRGGAQHQHVLTLDHFLDRLWSTSFIGRSMKHGGFCTHVRCAPWDPIPSLPGGKKSACRCRPAATQPAIPLCRVSSCGRPTRPGSSVRRMNGPAFIAAPPARGRRPPGNTVFFLSSLHRRDSGFRRRLGWCVRHSGCTNACQAALPPHLHRGRRSGVLACYRPSAPRRTVGRSYVAKGPGAHRGTRRSEDNRPAFQASRPWMSRGSDDAGGTDVR